MTDQNNTEAYASDKLAAYPELLKRYKETGEGSLLSVHLMPQNLCNHRCDFCSYRLPNNKNSSNFNEGAHIPKDKLDQLLADFKFLGVQGIETSVRGDEFIVTKNAGFVSLVTIADLVSRRPTNTKSSGVLDNGNFVTDEITEFIEHPQKEPLFQITLDTGRSIVVTKSHSVFFFNKNTRDIFYKPVSEASVGDLVVLSSKTTQPDKYQTEIVVHTKIAGSSTFQVTKSLLRLLGYYAAEGSLIKQDKARAILDNGIVLTFGPYSDPFEASCVDDVAQIINELGLQSTTVKQYNKTTIRCSNVQLFKLMSSIGDGARKKRIPDVVFNVSNEFKLEFLKGLFAGDGNFRNTRYKENYRRNVLALKTSSSFMVKTLSYLFDSLSVNHTINTGVNKERFIEGRRLQPSNYYSVNVSDRASVESLIDVVSFIGAQPSYKAAYQPYTQDRHVVISDDSYALKIKKIEQLTDIDEFVYDIAVADSHRFLSSFNILCHNTGGGEPLAYPHTEHLWTKLKEYGFATALVTNGTLLKDRAPLITSTRMKWARVSIDAGTVESYTKTRQCPPSHWTKAWKAVESFRDNAPKDPEFRLGVGFVQSNQNFGEVIEFVKLAKEHGADNVRLTSTFSDQHMEYFKDKDAVYQAVKDSERAKELYEDATFKVHNLIPTRVWETEHPTQDYEKCVTKDFLCVVEGECKVYTCCTFTGSLKGLYGKFSEHAEGFKGLWLEYFDWRKKFNAKKYCTVSCLYRNRNLSMIELLKQDNVPPHNGLHKEFI